MGVDGLAAPFLVLGCGRAGESAATTLARVAAPDAVRAWDGYDVPATRRCRERLAARGVDVVLGPWREELVQRPRPATVVKSPGLAREHPAVAASIAAGATIVDELDLGRRLSRRELLGVTGTDGKSTVCSLLARALGPATPIAGNTEFGPPLSGLDADGGPAVVEISSYQLEFCSEILASLGVLTNLAPDHLQRHHTPAAYGAAKRRLFLVGGRAVPRAVVNLDGAFGRALAADLRAAGSRVAGFGSAPDADYRVTRATWDIACARVELATPGGPVSLATRLPGRHNAENVAAALAASDLLGVPRERALAALTSAPGVPGRWEHVSSELPFDVIVDFGHTALAVGRALATARAVAAGRPGARVRIMIGAGGHNCPERRAPLGRVVSELADGAVITESNGRGEPAEEITAQIVAGARPGGAELEVVLDRREAMRRLFAQARPGDVVLVSGRGAMPRLLSNRSGEGAQFDDRVVAREELAALADRALTA